jgi:hypothetical protein
LQRYIERGVTSPLRRRVVNSGGVSLEFRVAVEAEQNGAHLVALGEDNLVEIAVLELVEETVQFSHRFANRRELGVGDANTLRKVGH